MRENKTTDKLAKIFRINIGRTLKSIKEFITIRENVMMKEAAALGQRTAAFYVVHLSAIPHSPEQGWPCTPGIGC